MGNKNEKPKVYHLKSKYALFTGFMIILSLILVSFIQGDYLNYRQAQSIHLFVAFVTYLFIQETRLNQKVVIVLLLFICLRQSVYIHSLLALDNQRSDNEAFVLQNIGYRIYSSFDDDKRVVICGKYHLGNNIDRQIEVPKYGLENSFFRLFNPKHETDDHRRFVDKIVSSTINWSLRAFENQEMLKHSFSYYGYDLNIDDSYFDRKTNQEYTKIAMDNNMKPLEIRDMGDYILVYLGELD